MTAAKPTAAEILRAEFPAGMVGKLPRVTCKDCTNAPGKVCATHSKSKCDTCGNHMTTAHMHLDYVGHAAVTDRLLQADPSWTWEFQAVNVDGSPVVVQAGLADGFAKIGLWIRLTVDGVTRPGFGEGKNFKECIGDAIRNAAMRFGVALDLWAKEDLHAESDGKAPQISAEEKTPPKDPQATETPTDEAAGATAGASSGGGPQSSQLAPAAQAGFQVPNPPPAPTADQLAAFTTALNEYVKVKPEFDPAAARKTAEGKDGPWILRQTARVLKNIEDAKVPA